VSWIALAIVLTQFVIVVLRYIFGVGWIMMQESIVYMFGVMFLAGAAYTLHHNGHVRVDIFYREAAPKRKALVDLIGSLVLLVPVCVMIAIPSWTYVYQSWSYLEGSKETSGIPAVFVLKSFILVFCFLVILQGISLAIHSLRVLRGLEELRPDEPHDVI
jgi:TRAP-type mannitol/chloroaromatic compound transport system permease small subunit